MHFIKNASLNSYFYATIKATFLKLKKKVFEVLTSYLIMTHAVLKTVTKYLFLETEGVKHKGTGQFLLGSYTF